MMYNPESLNLRSGELLQSSFMKNRPKTLSLVEKPLLLAVMALILTNFIGYGTYWCFLLIPFFIFNLYSNISLLDKHFISILIFSIIYTVFLIINNTAPPSNALLLTYLFSPSIFYFYGKYVIRKYPSNSTIYFVFFYICLLFSILPFLSNVRSVMQNGFMTVRSINLFWMSQQHAANATNIGSNFALNLSLLPLLFINRSKTKRLYTFISLFLLVIAVFSILNMMNRTGLGIMVLALFSYFFYSGDRIKSVLWISLFTLFLIFLYSFDILNFRTWFEYSGYYNRLANTGVYEQGSRFIIWKESLRSFLSYPFGVTYHNVSYMIGASYAHNLWLDVGLKTGFISLIPSLILTVSGLFSIAKITFNSNNEELVRALTAGFGIAFYVTFFVEPIMEGYSIFFFIYCFYLGILGGIREYM